MATEPSPQAPSSPPRKGGCGWLGLLVGLVLLGAMVWGGYRYFTAGKTSEAAAAGKHGHKNGDKIRVVPAQVARGDVSVYLVGLGSVTPLNSVTVKTRVDGQLMKVFFTEGQMVKQGDPLVQIDPRPYEAQLSQYKAQRERDAALLENAKIDEQRYETLWKQDSIPQQTLATSQATVKQDQGTVDGDDALIQQTLLNIEYCDVRAPIGGRVGLRLVDEGNQVHAGDAGGLLVINQIQPVNVVFTIPEDSVPAVMAKLSAGEQLPVEAMDRAKKNRIAQGVLQTTDNQIDPTTGTLKLKAVFTNTDSSLFPNQFVNAKLQLETKRGVIIVPMAAIQYGTQGTFVFTVDATNPQDATVTMKNVAVGTIDGERAEITSGLNEGEQVLVDGVDKLSTGSKVIISTGTEKHEQGGTTASAAPNS